MRHTKPLRMCTFSKPMPNCANLFPDPLVFSGFYSLFVFVTRSMDADLFRVATNGNPR